MHARLSEMIAASVLAAACLACCQCGGEALGDAGVDDAGARDAHSEDTDPGEDHQVVDAAQADSADAGFVCEIPQIEIPPGLDAGPSGCPPELAGLAGSFSGTWEGEVFGEFILVGAFTYASYGELAFEVFCLGDKLWVRGEMVGLAEGIYPFYGELLGRFDEESGTIEMVMEQGGLCLAEVILEDAGVLADAAAPADGAPPEDGALLEDGATPEDGGALEDGSALEDGAARDASLPDAGSAPDAGSGLVCPGLVVSFEVLLEGTQQQGGFEDGTWCGRSLFPPGAMGQGSWRAARDED